jgi:hypothetical protein
VGARFYVLSTLAPSPAQPPVQWVLALYWGKSGQSIMLTTHLLLVPGCEWMELYLHLLFVLAQNFTFYKITKCLAPRINFLVSQFENLASNIFIALLYHIIVYVLVYVLFPALKKKYDDAESACQLMKHDLESAKKDLCQVKEDVKWYVHRIMIVPALILQSCFIEEVNVFNSWRLG